MKINSRQLKQTLLPLCTLIGTTMAVAATPSQLPPTSHTGTAELHWVNSGFGPAVSPVAGDLGSGRHITYVKFDAGMATQLHTHSQDYVGIVLTGTAMHWEPGKPETRKPLTTGGHWFIPANVPHISECLPDSECIMAIYQQKAFDFKPTGE